MCRDCFRTPWGWVAAAWSDEGAAALVLPVASREEAEERLRGLLGPGGKRGAWRELREDLGEYFEGRGRSFSVPVAAPAPGIFTARVWRAAMEIPFGATSTYGEIARQAGRAAGARAVGRALGRNPVPLLIPCHRVVAAGGPGGFTAPGGIGMKVRLLLHEGGWPGRGTSHRRQRRKGEER